VAAGAAEEQLKRLDRAVGRIGVVCAQTLSGAVFTTGTPLGFLRTGCAGTTPRALTLIVLAAAASLGFKSFQCCSIVR
jgi:hypothetical protein